MSIKDSNIGRKFGKENQITVVERTDQKSGNNKKYKVHCSLCSQDKELFKEGYFKTLIQSLEKGSLPCGCGGNPCYTDEQKIILFKRECVKQNCKLLEVLPFPVRISTKFKIQCLTCDKIRTIRWPTFMVQKNGCPSCKNKHSEEKLELSNIKLVNNFYATGKFLEGTVFRRKGSSAIWEVVCPVCSKDEFVEKGLCQGIFYSHSSNLKVGNLPCRCSGQFRYSKTQQEYRIKKKCEEIGSVRFEKWLEGYNGVYTRILLVCSEHGEHETKVTHFLNGGCFCPACSATGFDTYSPASVYVLKISNGTSGFTGFGITKEFDKRLSTHVRELKKQNFRIIDSDVFDVEKGSIALKIENNIKNKFPLEPQTVKGFVKEATSMENYEVVVEFVQNSIFDDWINNEQKTS